MRNNYLLTIILLLLALNSIAQTYVVQVKDKYTNVWGYATVSGEVIIEPQFAKCYAFSEEGTAIVFYPYEYQFELINLKGEFLEIEDPSIILQKGLNSSPSGFGNGLVPVSKRRKLGYMNTQGKIAISCKYNYASEFSDGYAVAKRDKQYFVIDVNGNETIINNPQIKGIKKFSEGMAPFYNKNGMSGFINTEGKVIIPARFTGVGYFRSGVAWARTKEGLIGFINNNGDWVIEPQFIAVKNFSLESEIAQVRVKDTWTYIDKQGNILYPYLADSFDDYSEGFAKAVTNKKVGFLDNKQEWVIQPQFEATRRFKNGYAAAKQNGKWGLINTKGEWVIQPVYFAVKDVEIVDLNLN